LTLKDEDFNSATLCMDSSYSLFSGDCLTHTVVTVLHMCNFFRTKDADVIMYHFGSHALAPSTSAFCLKLETYFRMAGIKYSVCSR